MSDLDATVATAGYRGTKKTQIVHLRKGKGSFGSARALNIKRLVPDKPGSKHIKQESEKGESSETAGLSQINWDQNRTRKKAMVAQIMKVVGPR